MLKKSKGDFLTKNPQIKITKITITLNDNAKISCFKYSNLTNDHDRERRKFTITPTK